MYPHAMVTYVAVGRYNPATCSILYQLSHICCHKFVPVVCLYRILYTDRPSLLVKLVALKYRTDLNLNY